MSLTNNNNNNVVTTATPMVIVPLLLVLLSFYCDPLAAQQVCGDATLGYHAYEVVAGPSTYTIATGNSVGRPFGFPCPGFLVHIDTLGFLSFLFLKHCSIPIHLFYYVRLID